MDYIRVVSSLQVSSCDEGVAYLVEKGADVGQIVSGNITVLHISAEHGLKAAVAAILKTEMGRKCCDLKTDEGNSPLNLAAMAGHREIVEILLPCSLEGTDTDKEGCTIDQFMSDGATRMVEWEARKKQEQLQVQYLPIETLIDRSKLDLTTRMKISF
jgi:ankyrin repeat protein